MKKIILVLSIILASVNLSQAQTLVTFTLTDSTLHHTNIYLKGDMTNWVDVKMYDDSTHGDALAGDHIWTDTLTVMPGTYQWGVIENDGSLEGLWLIQGPYCTFTVDSAHHVSGQTTYAIPQPGTLAVTFVVDMTPAINEGRFDPDAGDIVDVVGPFTNWSITQPMEDLGDNLFTITTDSVFKVGKTLDFKFRINGKWLPDTVDIHAGAEIPGGVSSVIYRHYSVTGGDNISNSIWGEIFTHNILNQIIVDTMWVENGIPITQINLPDSVRVNFGIPDSIAGTGFAPVMWDGSLYDPAHSGFDSIPGNYMINEHYFNFYGEKPYLILHNGPAGISDPVQAQYSIYPNPAGDYLNVNNIKGVQHLAVYNIVGSRMMDFDHPDSDQLKISLSGLNPGIYFLRITTRDGSLKTIKFIKK